MSTATLKALADAQTAHANEALAEYLRHRFPDQFEAVSDQRAVDIVQSARTEARRFGVEREDNVARFLDLMIMFPGFPDVPWALTILNSDSLHGPDKIAMLLDKIRRQGIEF